MAKIKTQVALTKPQHDYLSAEANRLGIYIGELLRRVLDEHMTRNNVR